MTTTPDTALIARCGKSTNRRGQPFDAWALQEHERMCKECKKQKEFEKEVEQGK